MSAIWRRDLYANASRSGAKGAVIGWFMNPGFAVICLYRLMRWGRRRGGAIGKLLSVLAWRRIVKGYGCYIDPKAVLGAGVRFPHPVGIVIGEGTRIGEGVTIYQHVTFGRRDSASSDYPAIGDGVTIYAGATLIGAIAIGAGATVAAHALVRGDVPAGGLAVPASGSVRER